MATHLELKTVWLTFLAQGVILVYTVLKVEVCKSYSLPNFTDFEMLVNRPEFTVIICKLTFEVCLIQKLVSPFASISKIML